MKIVKPIANQTFVIDATPAWPDIEFETDATGSHVWSWSLVWGSFSRSGTETTPGNKWNAKEVMTDLGGTLTVKAQAGHAGAAASAPVSVLLRGTNPNAATITAYLAVKAGSAGFEKILEHESKYKHFNTRNEPVKSFDNGYGMCQLTTPTPSFEQVWNWKLNIDGGLALFAQKRNAAIGYLSQGGRSYTTDQLKYEAVARWNGGSYHEWDAKLGWVRKSSILCDTRTGNIGWDMTDSENKDKTESELRARDKDSYSGGRPAGAHWSYLGVCYADRILG